METFDGTNIAWFTKVNIINFKQTLIFIFFIQFQLHFVLNFISFFSFLFFLSMYQCDIQALKEKKLFQLVFSKENKARPLVVSNFRRQYVSKFFLLKFIFSKLLLVNIVLSLTNKFCFCRI